ncbi:MAG: glycosyltransferase [Caldilinea sp.]|nr:glycosyltransferase [Caldilineaceae bacterium]MCB9121326.1 glycosyltransferase [Caldilineaceae bacterium]MCO5210735.1 glycosyltransferase [Caldilinea sp.]MCW5843397.1 glycosyltransferase [Caldilinea sp.]
MTQQNEVAVSVILPTFNERDNICDLVDVIHRELEPAGYAYEVLVVDDNSPDGTAEVVRLRYRLEGAATALLPGSERGRLRLFVRTQNRGLANSIRDGLLAAQGQTLVVMDTDFNHDPAMIPQMVDLLRYYDLVIGSRFVMRGGMEDRLRYHFSQIYNVFIRALFQTQIQDNLSGYFAIRRERLYSLAPLFPAIFYGYGDYFIRLLLAAWRQGWKILEVPVFYILRRHGDSKTGFWSVFKKYTAAVLRLRLNGLNA